MQTLNLTKKYEKYSEYKDSGIEWLGKIPKEWRVGKVKEVFNLSKQKSFGNLETDVLSLTQHGIKLRDLSSNEGQIAATYEGYMKIIKGDIVLNTMDLITGFVDSSKFEGIISPAYAVLRKKNNLNSQFYNYFFQKHYYEKIFHPFGVGVSVDHRWTLKDYALMNFSVVSIPEVQQTKIANYLDAKTQLIDQIIEKKKKLIELLREKRTAVINQVVTKGLDPKAKFINSGVEWIGKMPKNWEIKKVKHILTLGYGKELKPEDRTDGSEYFVYGANGAVGNSRKYLYSDPSIIIGRKGSVGELNLVDKPFWPLDVTYYTKIFKGICLKWVYYILLASNMKDFGTGIKPGLSRAEVYNMEIPFINNDLQKQVIDYLDIKTSNIDKALSLIELQMNKLNEYRSSLISNVVTGKVRVN